jgi:hypothetical protein
MTLRHHFNSGRFLENGKRGLRKVALRFPALGFRLSLGLGHIQHCHESKAQRN